MKIIRTNLAGLLLAEPMRHCDERGSFYENYRESAYSELGVDSFCQDNISCSRQGVLRGLHYQVKKPQAQLVTVVVGKIFDVVVDLRRDSNTFGVSLGTELSDSGIGQIFMEGGFAHGFCVLSDFAILHYKVTEEYDSSDEAGLLWRDKALRISWPVSAPIISERDAGYPPLDMIDADSLPFPTA